MIREVDGSEVVRAVRALAISAAHDFEPDILEGLLLARDRGTVPLAKNLLEVLVQNAEIASRERIPVCRDTGIAVVFVGLGDDGAALERTILEQINAEGCGSLGMGGLNTALAVHIETFPTHIASLPVAVTLQCHAHRHKEIII